MSDPEKPTIDKVTLLPDQPLTPQETQACTHFLRTYEPKIHWEVGQKVTAYLGTKIVTLYIREIDPRNRFFGYLHEDGEIHIVPHEEIGGAPTPAAPLDPSMDALRLLAAYQPKAATESTDGKLRVKFSIKVNTLFRKAETEVELEANTLEEIKELLGKMEGTKLTV